MTAAAAMVWATHRDWTATEIANSLVRSATPLGKEPPSRNWGYGRLDVNKALHTAQAPGSARAQRLGRRGSGQRPLHPGAVVVASLGWAGDAVDAYTVDVPVGTTARAVLRSAAPGISLGVLSTRSKDDALAAVARARTRPTQVVVPEGRHLVVVARSQGAGAYRLVLSAS